MKTLLNFVIILSFSFVYSQNQTEGTLLDTDYEPIYYRLEMNLNPYQSDFSGQTTVHFNTTDNLIEFQINAKPNLTIESVVYHQNNISNYSRNGDVLSIQLPEQLPANRLDSIAISFSGNENSSQGLSLGSHADVPIIETLAEPWHGSTWWVCKDDLDDKVAKLDVFVTHPSEFKAASNGLLKSVSPVGNDMSVTHWQHNYPIPVYLIGIAVTNYAEYNNSVNIGGTTVPIVNYLYPETLSNWTDNLDDVPSHITNLSELFGEYPYKNEKYGHAQWNRSGGMEHSTMSFMGKFTFNLIVHELAHQWFGDKVTCATWHDIWLNEGFADYCTGLMTEHYYGDQSFKDWKTDRIDIITSQNDGSVYNPDAENEGRIFNSRLTYKKGSMVVHLIRFILNDDNLFFQSVRNFLDDPDYAWDFADTEDLKESLTASTGRNWDDFFNDWIYGEGHPILNISVSKTPGSDAVDVNIHQNGSHSSVPYFHFPFEIEFRGSGGQKTVRRLDVNSPDQSFWFNDIGFNVTSFVANPGFDIICKINSSVLKTEEIAAEIGLKVYPNPAADFLNLESASEIKQIEVFDASGKLVYKASKLNKTKLQIPVRNWAKGVYLIQVQNGDTKLTKKFIKE